MPQPGPEQLADPVDEPPPLTLRDPLPPVVDTAGALAATIRSVATGTGPVALDAERASGHRYSQRAYLVQLRRVGSGTALIDPIPFPGLDELGAAIGDTEWVLHAATQDLMCLAEIGLRPTTLFDTELAARLLNVPRVGLATLVSELLGSSLAKEHSAVDWSTRPLPEPWLVYAALDVEVLLELRTVLIDLLTRAGKLGWAHEEFDALTRFGGPTPRAEPWRRTSGIHKVRGRRPLAVVRELWQARDEVARRRDTAPSRVLPDSLIAEIATTMPKDGQALRGSTAMRRRGARRHLDAWSDAYDRALAQPEDQLPLAAARPAGPPPARVWAQRHPVAAARLSACRGVISELATAHELPAENVLSPELVRRLAWEPPEPADEPTVAAVLAAGGARMWQIGLTTPGLCAALDAGRDG